MRLSCRSFQATSAKTSATVAAAVRSRRTTASHIAECGCRIRKWRHRLGLGWWGSPWGTIFTPVHVGRNITGLCWGPNSGKPSTALRDIVRLHLGAQVLQRIQSQPPVIPK